MKTKRSSILIALLIILSIGLILISINNFKISHSLKESNLKLSIKDVELGTALWAIDQYHKYTNKKLTDFNLIANGQKQPFSLILNNEYKLFYKFSLEDCSSCIESEIKYINDLGKHINILIEALNSREYKAFIAINHIDTTKVFQIEKPILEEAEQPFYFIANRDQYIKDIYFPMQEFPNLTHKYYQIVKDKYFN